MTTEDDRIYQLAQQQAATNANLARALNDLNSLGNVMREHVKELTDRSEELEEKINSVSLDLKIYKSFCVFLAAGVGFLGWIISNFENIKSVFKG